MSFTLHRLIFVINLFFLSACQTAFDTVSAEQLGKIYDLRTGKTLTPSEFAEKAASAPRLLLGEQHDNLKHHQAHFWLIQQLQQKRPQSSVLMEMLSVDQQPLIAKIAANPTASYADLPQQLNWKKSWNWDFYGDIVKTVLQQRINLVATNLTADEVQTLMNGAEPLKGYRSTEPAVQQQIADLITANHGFDPKTSGQNQEIIRKMVQVQQFRDRRMAEKMLNSPTPSLLIAGNHHINRRFGVPLHLSDLSPNTNSITVLFGNNPNQINADSADYYWLLK